MSIDGNFKMPTPVSYPPGLYELIVANQTEGEWSHREELRFLREWGHRLIHQLDLRAKDAQFVALPLIQIRRLRNLKTLGQYDPLPDGYRIAGTISFNEERLPDLTEHEKLALLLKLLVEAWQHQRGVKPGSDDQALRAETRRLGLAITRQHKITIHADGKFRRVLEAHGIETPIEPKILPPPTRPAKSTLNRWTCGCQTVLVGRGEFLGRCTHPECGHEFRRVDYRD
jgi:hypothetical protein